MHLHVKIMPGFSRSPPKPGSDCIKLDSGQDQPVPLTALCLNIFYFILKMELTIKKEVI